MHDPITRLVGDPAAPAIDLATAKTHLRVDGNDDDSLIEGLIAAAHGYLNGRSGQLGRSLVNESWEYVLAGFPLFRSVIDLPMCGVSEVTGITYDDADGEPQTLDPSAYSLISDRRLIAQVVLRPAYRWPATLPGLGGVAIAFTSGFGATADDVPVAIKQAMLLMIGHWYDAPDGASDVDIPASAEALIAPYRRRTP